MSHRLVETKQRLQLSGCFLVASPDHPDPQVGRDVFLVTWHDDQGSVGVLLNRALVGDFRNVWAHILGPQGKQMPSGPIHYGGPLAGPMVALHNRPDLAEAEVSPGIYITARLKTLQKLSGIPATECRWIAGHVAWQVGELEKQIEKGWWYAISATPDLVFSSADEIWPRAIRRAGDVWLALVTGAPAGVTMVPHSGMWN
jgi:putative transcriptional regulator